MHTETSVSLFIKDKIIEQQLYGDKKSNNKKINVWREFYPSIGRTGSRTQTSRHVYRGDGSGWIAPYDLGGR